MARDNSNIKYSCNFLDEVIDNIKKAETYIEKDNTALEYLSDCYHTKNSPIEKAREIHDDLRSWGNRLFDELKEANGNAEYYEKEYNKAITDLEYYKQKCEELETKLEELV
jgi:chromosome segregation ATPase